MKMKPTILVMIFVFGASLCWAQTDESQKQIHPPHPRSGPPFTVLKVDGRSLEFDPKKNARLDFDTIDPNSIESIDVLKGTAAIEKYGDNAKEGIVIINIKEFSLLPQELQNKFTKADKK